MNWLQGTFPDGTKLVTIHSPIALDHGDLALALYGSFLPVPDSTAFELASDADIAFKPGAVAVEEAVVGIALNQGREHVAVRVTNMGDRPIQVGSHYHFIETNAALQFDRMQAYGKRLGVAAGTSVRFEPGEIRTVTLVAIAGNAIVHSGNGITGGAVADSGRAEALARVEAGGFGNVVDPDPPAPEPVVLSRPHYAALYGPTRGDRIRLGDTCLHLAVEHDYLADHYGDDPRGGGPSGRG